ncbi:hypothetical protein PHMEG_00029653 [Phytophthora megakarya]|uniref:DUF659 domain-containing protein n=1 Tax=Phytophthora megakarya TaxID=4795 RepID=A0A225V236_9STRA|nr:hypothetical protein PHMEG_00029653 [Phytophthora megakarya]
MYSTKSRHDGLAIAEQMESVMKGMKEKGWNHGAVVTDNAGQCERARGILALPHPRLPYIPCKAHDTNRLVYATYYYQRYVTYYYRRYCETDDTEGLAGELHSWYRGKFVDSKIVQFNGDVAGYWSFVSDIRKQSKLLKLAAVIRSIEVNTLTCEMFFSELAAIHTAKK